MSLGGNIGGLRSGAANEVLSSEIGFDERRITVRPTATVSHTDQRTAIRLTETKLIGVFSSWNTSWENVNSLTPAVAVWVQ